MAQDEQRDPQRGKNRGGEEEPAVFEIERPVLDAGWTRSIPIDIPRNLKKPAPGNDKELTVPGEERFDRSRPVTLYPQDARDDIQDQRDHWTGREHSAEPRAAEDCELQLRHETEIVAADGDASR